MDHLPEAVFVNLYGPTEVTCNCLYHIIDRDRAYDEGIPLGIAFPNRQVLLVGEDGSLVTEPGATGEILVRGVSLALGYVGDEKRTAAVFTQNPLHGDADENPTQIREIWRSACTRGKTSLRQSSSS